MQVTDVMSVRMLIKVKISNGLHYLKFENNLKLFLVICLRKNRGRKVQLWYNHQLCQTQRIKKLLVYVACLDGT